MLTCRTDFKLIKTDVFEMHQTGWRKFGYLMKIQSKFLTTTMETMAVCSGLWSEPVLFKCHLLPLHTVASIPCTYLKLGYTEPLNIVGQTLFLGT